MSLLRSEKMWRKTKTGGPQISVRSLFLLRSGMSADIEDAPEMLKNSIPSIFFMVLSKKNLQLVF